MIGERHKLNSHQDHAARLVLLVLLIIFACPAMATKIYTCDNDAGDPIFQDIPCKDRASQQINLEGNPDNQGVRYRVQRNIERYYPQPPPDTGPSVDPGPAPSELALAALREGKNECGSRHMGRSREQLLKFQGMMEVLDDPERKERELFEIGCHLAYLDRMDEARANAGTELPD